MHREDSARRHEPTATTADTFPGSEPEEQAVLVTFALPDGPAHDAVIEKVDVLATSVAHAIARDRVGQFAGVQRRAGAMTLFTYGAVAERLWRSIRPIVVDFPPRPAHVVLRYGWFGAPGRTLEL